MQVLPVGDTARQRRARTRKRDLQGRLPLSDDKYPMGRIFTQQDFDQFGQCFDAPELGRLLDWLERRLRRRSAKGLVLSVRLDAATVDALRKVCVHRGTTYSHEARAAIEEYLRRNPG